MKSPIKKIENKKDSYVNMIIQKFRAKLKENIGNINCIKLTTGLVYLCNSNQIKIIYNKVEFFIAQLFTNPL